MSAAAHQCETCGCRPCQCSVLKNRNVIRLDKNPRVAAADEQVAARAREADAICRSLALSNPDVNEDGEIFCAVCNQQIHCGWPSLHEHLEECAWRLSVAYAAVKP